MNGTLCFWRHRWAPGTCRGLVLCSVRLTRGSAGARPSVSAKRVCSSLSPIKMVVIETKTAYKWHRGWAEALHISCEVRRAVQPQSTAASAPLWFFPPSLPLSLPSRGSVFRRTFGNMPNSFPALLAHGKGIRCIWAAPKPPYAADHECWQSQRQPGPANSSPGFG